MRPPYLDMYGTINSGAHRQAAELIGAPAFVWHTALWNPAHGDSAQAVRAKNLESFIANVYDNIGRMAGTECRKYGEIAVKPTDRAEVISFTFNWNGMRAKLRFDIHAEYLSITSIIDISISLNDKPSDNNLFNKMKDNLNHFITGTCPTNGSIAPEIPDIDDVYTFIYNDIWDSHWFPQVLNFDVGGRVFAEFRGFITCEQYPSECEQEGETAFTEQLYKQKEIQSPFYKQKNHEGARKRWQRTSIPQEEWARYRLANVWPFLSLEPRGQSASMTGRTEFTVSRVLDGRVLFVTALGPQPKEGQKGNERPVYFYIHSVTQCERQIGRLVDRLVHMGTLRLAAIIALPALKAVGGKVERLEKDITQARIDTHNLIVMANSQNRGQLEVKQGAILKQLGDVQDAMAALSAGTDPRDEEYLGQATIEYRLIRSRMYRALFDELVKSLRIKRLEGYQPYDEFVQRRLGRVFRFIEGVERRIQQVKEEWRALDQLYLTTTVTILTAEIETQQEETVKVERTIEQIQSVGETLVIGLLSPYYFIRLLLDVLNCEKNVLCTREVYGITWEQAGVIVIWVAFIIGAGMRFYYNKQRHKGRSNAQRPLGHGQNYVRFKLNATAETA